MVNQKYRFSFKNALRFSDLAPNDSADTHGLMIGSNDMMRYTVHCVFVISEFLILYQSVHTVEIPLECNVNPCDRRLSSAKKQKKY